MRELPFDIELIRFLAEHRTPLLTSVFSFFTSIGQIQGYVLMIALLFVLWDKQLANRLAILTLATMSLNHLLKILVMNPRPFISDGSYTQKWAVSPATAEDSTPSGHAMGGAAFFAYFAASVNNRWVRLASILLILLTGLSRPYLGVHYLEDVLIGWALGVAIALLAFRYTGALARIWDRLALPRQIGVVGAASLLLWLVTRALGGAHLGGQPLAFVSYTGFLMGLVIPRPLEAKWADFDPRSAGVLRKALRLVLCVGLVMGTLMLLDVAFAALCADDSALGIALRYVRYALAGVAGMLVAPLLFVKWGLAERMAAAAGAR